MGKLGSPSFLIELWTLKTNISKSVVTGYSVVKIECNVMQIFTACSRLISHWFEIIIAYYYFNMHQLIWCSSINPTKRNVLFFHQLPATVTHSGDFKWSGFLKIASICRSVFVLTTGHYLKIVSWYFLICSHPEI